MGIGWDVFGSASWIEARENRQRIKTLRKHLRSRSRVNRERDERLDALERENEQLELCVASLVRLLVEKGVVAESELAELVPLIDEDDSADDDIEGPQSD